MWQAGEPTPVINVPVTVDPSKLQIQAPLTCKEGWTAIVGILQGTTPNLQGDNYADVRIKYPDGKDLKVLVASNLHHRRIEDMDMLCGSHVQAHAEKCCGCLPQYQSRQ